MNTIVEPNKSALVALCKSRGLKGYSNKSVDELKAMLSQGCSANKSPLRYPGGKTRAIKILDRYIKTHYKDCKTVLSPFFGGGSFEIYLHDNGHKVFGNDLFKPLYTFWKQCTEVESIDALVKSIRPLIPVSKEKFHQLRTNISTMKDPLDIATAYYIINRCSFSGSTFCGGFSTQAASGRLNDASLATLAGLKIGSIEFSNMDFGAFLDKFPDKEDLVIYADPPYYISSYIYGKDGDLHESFDHVAFAKKIKSRKRWILSYNDCEYVRNLYSDCRIFKESWSYGMNATKASSEIIILPTLF